MSYNDDEEMDSGKWYQYSMFEQEQRKEIANFEKELRNDREDGDRKRGWNEEERQAIDDKKQECQDALDQYLDKLQNDED
uniref:Uncharacterized protein n=1 Tax=Panagrolaimus sp. JU765 TaxID=591449 RepID=A0AC34Q6U9_9BILA